MASKRMFTMKICDSDAFLDMPLSAQCLYFHLNMRADDDGFIDNPKRITRLIGANEDDLKLLIAKRFVLAFESGVIVIKHWRMHNTLSKNRYYETQYLDEKAQLLLKENGAYSLNTGVSLDDTKLIEMSKRQVRRTIDEQKTNSDIGLGLDIDIYKELDKSNSMSDFSSPTSKKSNDFSKVADKWNELSDLGLNKVTKINPTTNRGKMLKARLKEYSLDDVLKAIDNVKQSDFLLGNNNRGWMITFDWFVKPNNFVKVLEGNYNNSKPTTEDKPVTTDHKDTKSAAMEIFGEF